MHRLPRTLTAVLLSSACALAATPSAAQDSDLRFRRYGVSDGLPTTNVRTVAQDRFGFLWLATPAGVIRFDGENFRAFGPEPGERFANVLSNVRTALEDSSGRLWVGTEGGLFRFERAARRFEPVSIAGDPEGASPPYVTVLTEAPAAALWVGTAEHGLCRLPAGSDSLVCHRHDPDEPATIPTGAITDVSAASRGRLWVAMEESGLARLDPGTDVFESFRHDPADPGALPSDGLNTVHEDREGRVWVGFYSAGLAELDADGRRVRHFMPEPGTPGRIAVNAVRDILEDREGRIWIATWAGGVAQLDPETGRFATARRDPDDRTSLSDDRALHLTQDRLGQIWVATYDGLNVHDPSTRVFGLLRREPGRSETLSDDKIRSVLEARDGTVWVGTYGEGLNRWEPETGRIESFGNIPGDPTSLANEGIWDLLEDARGRIWVATSRGVHRWNPDTRDFTRYQERQDTPEPFATNNILALAEDRDGALWLGTWGEGVDRFDPETGEVTHHPPAAGGMPGGGINELHVDARNRLWVAGDGGMVRMDVETGEVVDLGLPDGATSVHGDPGGRVWVGTHGGLLLWDEGAGVLANPPAGPLHLEVHAIAGGEDDELWIGTADGLVRYAVGDGRTSRFDEADGLQGPVFTVGAADSGESGRLYFGGVGGLTWFDPDEVAENRTAPDVRLTDFLLLNRPVDVGEDSPLRADIGWADEVVLDHTDYSFSFEFAALNLRQPEKNAYRYMLEGVDPDWVTADPRYPRITYTGVQPGSYVFRVQGSNDDGVWSPQEASVAVRILPPWWETRWFQGLAAFLTVLGVAGAFRWRTAALEARNELLEGQVRARTAELEESNRRLEEASLTDPLTGLRNRRFLVQQLPGDLEQSLRRTRSGADDADFLFILIDVDHFKSINDTHGHEVGDLVLRGVADALVRAGRASDYAVRIGGEEFLVIGRFTHRDRAFEAAERIRTAIGATELDIGAGRSLRVSVSVGVACFPFDPDTPDALDWEHVLGLADHALYRAKRSGRDRTVGVSAGPEALADELRDTSPEEFGRRVAEGSLLLETSDSPRAAELPGD